MTFSMLEIYNEQVRDLLTKDNPKGGLQVRMQNNVHVLKALCFLFQLMWQLILVVY